MNSSRLRGWLALALLVPAALRAQAPDFSAVDRYADAAPAAAEASVASLAAYLARSGDDELTRTRALYRWITGHISYDVRGLQSGDVGDLSPDGVLRRRAAVCQGYAGLTRQLGLAMGLRVEVVSGWSKGYGYTAGQRFEGAPNHAWNAVMIGGHWRLMDPTWGAGYLDPQRMQFVRRFQEHYFLTDPSAFVFDHLPEDSQWQLLDHPITASQYGDLVYLRPMFFIGGFRIGRVRVTLGTTQPVDLGASVVDLASGRELQHGWAFAQQAGDSAEIVAAFPAPGRYALRLFSRPRGSTGRLEWVLDYEVQARGADDGGLPDAAAGFAQHGVQLLEPMQGRLVAGQAYRFRLRAPGADDLAIVVGEQWTHLVKQGDDFTLDFTAPGAGFALFARYPGDGSSYTGLLRFGIR